MSGVTPNPSPEQPDPESLVRRRKPRSKSRRMVPAAESGPVTRLTPEQRLLVLDVWVRSKLPAKDFVLAGNAKVRHHPSPFT